MGALDGMKVLDLTQYEAGTSATQYLAWFGATVYKVEKPGRGDPGRRSGAIDARDGLYFLSFNANKEGLAIDLESPEGRELFLRLVPKVDAVVENFTLGTMEKLGIGYDVLKTVHPEVIYATIKSNPHPLGLMLVRSGKVTEADLDRALLAQKSRRGVKFGRKAKLSATQIHYATRLINQGEAPQRVAQSLGVGRSTLYRALQREPG